MLVIGDRGCKRNAGRVASKCQEALTRARTGFRTWRLADENVFASMAGAERSGSGRSRAQVDAADLTIVHF
jgi:hypothetical protein